MLFGHRPHVLRPGQNVLVWGASGGLGSYAVQLCAVAGANAIGVISDDTKTDFVLQMGAKGVINRNKFKCWGQLPKVNTPEFNDYMKEARKFGKAIWQITGNKDVDIVFEHPGEATMPVSVFVVKRGGMVVICAGTTGFNLTMDARFLWMRQKRVQGSHFANLLQASQANQLMLERRIDPCMSEVFPWARHPEAGPTSAHEKMLDNKHLPGNMAVLVTSPKPGLCARFHRRRAGSRALPTGWAWLAAILAIEVFAWHVRSRLLAGDVRFQLPHLIALSLVSIAWVVLVLLLWQSSAEVARIASVMTLFSLAFYGVAGGYKSASILLVVGTPPVLALFGILTSLAWTTQEFGPALLTTFATLGTCLTIAFTGWTLHRSDKRLETANGDLRSLTSRLTVLAERERIASNAKENFLANVSHEIRTPLNGIVGLAASLETAALSARDLQSVDVIRQSGEMLERLISDVLDAAAINAGKLQLKPRPFDPAELARSTILLMEGEAASKGLSLSLALSPDTPPRLLGDDLRIRQIILNLLSNAIKYTETGAVTLEVGVDTLVENTDSAVLRLSVIDTGRGFDLASQNRLFERFERGERSGSDANAGLGLGLAITHALVVAMGGDIRASSVVGTGSKFEVTLPLPRALPPCREKCRRRCWRNREVAVSR
jgi:signal transduction histidine kinase